MKKIELSDWEREKNPPLINDVSNQIRGFLKKRNDITTDKLATLCDNIKTVLKYWTGNTFVGDLKTKQENNAFNSFFNSLLDFILYVKDNPVFVDEFRELMSSALYQGELYRYLGYSSDRYQLLKGDIKPVKPEFNDTYVSWSKNECNSYLESKFQGPVTKLKCTVPENMYGIDLAVFNVSRGEEDEVVFPTIKDTIVNIE